MSRDQFLSGPARIPKGEDADGAGSARITDMTGAAEVAVAHRPSLADRLRRGRARVYPLPLAMAALTVALVAVFEPQFYRPANLHVLMQQWSVLGLVTLGQLLVLLVAGIDLSVGAVMNASLIIIALMNGHGLLVVSLLLCLALGALVGAANGVLLSLREGRPFAAPLGMLPPIHAASLVSTHGIPPGNIPHPLQPT